MTRTIIESFNKVRDSFFSYSRGRLSGVSLPECHAKQPSPELPTCSFICLFQRLAGSIGGRLDLLHEIVKLRALPTFGHIDGGIARIGNKRHSVRVVEGPVGALDTFEHINHSNCVRTWIADSPMHKRLKDV